jgi:membrane protein DedA with SNARE-associated domain
VRAPATRACATIETVRRSLTVAAALPLAALLHLHRFHGSEFDYLGLAAAAAASWVGVPGPGEPVLIAAGVLAARHRLDLTEVLLIAWVAATLGGIVGWAVGLKAGRAVVTAPGPLHHLRIRALERGEAVFARWPVIAIVMSPSWVAGILRVGPTVYNVTNAVSALSWALGLGLGGFLVGPPVIDLFDDAGTVASIVIGVVIVFLLGLELGRRRRRRRAQPQAGG